MLICQNKSQVIALLLAFFGKPCKMAESCTRISQHLQQLVRWFQTKSIGLTRILVNKCFHVKILRKQTAFRAAMLILFYFFRCLQGLYIEYSCAARHSLYLYFISKIILSEGFSNVLAWPTYLRLYPSLWIIFVLM